MAQCYEKLGAAQTQEAQKTYKRIVRDFPDQKETAAEAQNHLAIKPTLPESGLVEQQLQINSDGPAGLSADGRYLLCINWRFASAVLSWHDLAGGKDREFLSLNYADGDLAGAILSPDGTRSVYGFSLNGASELREISVDGSGSRTLLKGKDKQDITPMDWSRDGKLILVEFEQSEPRSFGFAVVSFPEGSVKILKSVSPDGRRIASAGGGPKQELWVAKNLLASAKNAR